MSTMTLTEAAEHMRWSRRTLTRALARHGIATIGTGRRARLTQADLEALQAKERGICRVTNSMRPESERETEPMSFDSGFEDAREKEYWRRRLGQLQRRKPNAESRKSKVVPLGN